MERIHMNYLKDLVHRIRSGESDKRIAREMKISRTTVRKYRLWAEGRGFLKPDALFPDNASLSAVLGKIPSPPQEESSAKPYLAPLVWGRAVSSLGYEWYTWGAH